ncbi:ATP-dependent helicase [Clostridium aestuarii]|uniref:DNA 3'-5' helicase n=1 Tax=Clostridium aestuarii TaxID=338193 RepID=A0ABT4D083_9CLOT|nr:ATP-dependent helicase [Clostridium aestuarii]MCY6484644.1 ATP-dependent helicase [Clostridium aestuarii]
METDAIRTQYYNLRDKIIEKKYEKLNIQQREAVLSNEKNLALIACPGAGKTTTLIRRINYLTTFGPIYKTNYIPENVKLEDIKIMEKYLNSDTIISPRIEYLLKSKVIHPGNIIVMTFTRAAALNMKEKYKGISNSKNIPFFGTFHGLFYKILSRYYKKINIIDHLKAYRLIKGVLSTYLDEVSDEKIKETLNSISFYKTNNITMDKFTATINKDIFVECFRSYEDYKKQNNLFDFDDLQIKCRDIFLNNHKLLNGYQNLFKYILVDEFQDCDEMQIDILKLLNKYNSIFAVGDEDQCIYGFRGSKPECMVNFDEHFNNGKKLFLSINYRCPKSVVYISNNLIKNNKFRNYKNMRSYKENEPKINVMNYANEGRQAEDISLNILKLRELGKYDYCKNAVIYRTNMESRSIIDAFIRKKIPFKLLDKEYNFFNHFICKDILSYLRLSIDSTDKESFLRIINKPFRYISKINIEKVKKNQLKEDCFENLKEVKDIPIFQIKTIENLKKDIQNLNKISLEGAISYILSSLGYHNFLKEYSTKFKLDISELEEIVEEFKSSAREYKTIITLLAHVDEVEEQINNINKDKAKDGIILSTIHGVKGMEFRNVFIINCNEETIPHINNMQDNLEEERRLFYVGLTRAEENLWLCISNEIRGKNKKVSRFIKECNVNLLLKNTYKEGEKVVHNTFGEGEIKFIDEKKVEIKFKDNIIRSFDVLAVYNNGLIKKS